MQKSLPGKGLGEPSFVQQNMGIWRKEKNGVCSFMCVWFARSMSLPSLQVAELHRLSLDTIFLGLQVQLFGRFSFTADAVLHLQSLRLASPQV
jgi:hypothetical protein